MVLDVTVAVSGEYGAYGLWFEDEESKMSVSEFRYAVCSGKVWSECVELDDELFFIDEGEGLWLSILKYFYFNTVKMKFCFNYNFFFSSFFIQIVIYYYLSSTFFQQDFENMKIYPFHRGKVDILFVVVGGNCICHKCVFGDYYSYRSHEYQISFLGWHN